MSLLSSLWEFIDKNTFNRNTCKYKPHIWKFHHNDGIPLSVNGHNILSDEEIFKGFAEGRFHSVNRCSRCGIFDREDDGLDSHQSYSIDGKVYYR